MLPQDHVILEIQQQVVARHDAVGEEAAGHPVAVVAHLEGMGEFAMREEAYEQSGRGAIHEATRCRSAR